MIALGGAREGSGDRRRQRPPASRCSLRTFAQLVDQGEHLLAHLRITHLIQSIEEWKYLIRFDPIAVDAWMTAAADRKREKKRKLHVRMLK